MRDLYALYPDYLIDVAAEQAALAAARLVVWQHPIHWYGMPPLMKLWLDEVLAFGWAYGPGGTALRGKDLWLVATTGGAEDSYRPDSYNRYFFDAFLPPYEQTAALCGMRFLPPLLLHGAHKRERGRARAPTPSVYVGAARQLSRLARDRRAARPGAALRGAAHGAAARERRRKRPDGTRPPGSTASLVYLAAAVIAVPLAQLARPRLDHRLPRRRHR